MNPRIQELIKQASYNIIETNGAPIISNEFNKEKFAELIVRECVTICEQQRTKILQNPNDPSWTEHLAEVQTNIKQRFGVEK
jgi:hypothetical protein